MQDIAFELDGESGRPVFLQLAHAIIAAVERGRLKPGQRLPGTRTLARTLALHRNTVDAAYHEAAMQGWLVAHAARGTFVAHDLPVDLVDDLPVEAATIRPGRTRRAAVESPSPSPAAPPVAPAEPPLLRVSDGAPDARLLPVAELARALRRALRRSDFLHAGGYGDARGAPALRTALADHLAAERAVPVDADAVLVTRGSQMALFLAASALLAPGESIAVEEPGYPLAAAAFRAAGARVVPVPVDADGLCLDGLDAARRATPGLRAVYVTPHHQYPTTVTMGAARRIGLIDLARRHGLAIVEDDYDHEYRFDGRPVLPLAARADGGVDLVYVGSLSKVLAPGLRLGYAAASPALVGRMAALREAIDRQGDVPLENAVAALLREGDLGRHVRKTRRVYHARRDRLVAALRAGLGDRLSCTVPAGGLALWARLAEGLDAAAWSAAARARGLAVTPGAALCVEPAAAPQAFRLGFATLDEDEMARAVAILAASAGHAVRRVAG